MDDIGAIQECINSKASLEAEREKLGRKRQENQIEVQNLLAGKGGIKKMLGGNKDDKQLVLQKRIDGVRVIINDSWK